MSVFERPSVAIVARVRRPLAEPGYATAGSVEVFTPGYGLSAEMDALTAHVDGPSLQSPAPTLPPEPKTGTFTGGFEDAVRALARREGHTVSDSEPVETTYGRWEEEGYDEDVFDTWDVITVTCGTFARSYEWEVHACENGSPMNAFVLLLNDLEVAEHLPEGVAENAARVGDKPWQAFDNYIADPEAADRYAFLAAIKGGRGNPWAEHIEYYTSVEDSRF